MIPRIARIAAWLATGAAMVFGLFWLLIGTPESNVPALAASMLLVFGIVLVTAFFVSSALAMASGAPFGRSLATSGRSLHWAVVATVPALLLWWAVVRVDRWVAEHSGEINAWFIARFGWGDIGALFRAELWTSRWLRWSLIPLVALALLGALLDGGWHGALGRWRRRVISVRALLTAVIVFVVLMVLPLPLIGWRPELPPTWVQPAAAAARLGAVALLWTLAAALLVVIAAPVGPSTRGVVAND